jgi:hypothetical protein
MLDHINQQNILWTELVTSILTPLQYISSKSYTDENTIQDISPETTVKLKEVTGSVFERDILQEHPDNSGDKKFSYNVSCKMSLSKILQCELVHSLGFEVFTGAVNIKISVSWDVRPCSMIILYQNF